MDNWHCKRWQICKKFKETLAAELATRGSTTLAKKATVLIIGFPELNRILDSTRTCYW